MPDSVEARWRYKKWQQRTKLKSEAAESNAAVPEEGRVAKRRRITRARLLEAAYQVLDCVIHDFGRRNIVATRRLRRKDPALVMPVSMRLVMREAARTPMWQWWALRPDILVDRMRDGFGPFGKGDMRDAIDRGIFHISANEIESAWALANWMMVGGIHDIVVGQRTLESDMFVVNAVMRMMGVDHKLARRISSTPLPRYSAPKIDAPSAGASRRGLAQGPSAGATRRRLLVEQRKIARISASGSAKCAR